MRAWWLPESKANFFPKTEHHWGWRLWWKLRRRQLWEICWHLNYSGNMKHGHQLPEKHSLNAVLSQHHCIPTPVLSKLWPELLGTTTNRTWGWTGSDALQLVPQPANTALCSFTVAGRNTNLTAAWACLKRFTISLLALCDYNKFGKCFAIIRSHTPRKISLLLPNATHIEW